MRLLLDTQTLIWFLTDSPKLPLKVRKQLLAPEAELFFSSVSVLEVALKHSLKPEQMPCSADELKSDSEASALRELPFVARHALKVGELPWLHRDPFDRMLIAQAMCEDMMLVSHDVQVLSYGGNMIGF